MESKPIQRDAVWAEWCPIHHGVPPSFDTGGYVCASCGRTVCAACIYSTNIGVLCQECAAAAKGYITKIEPLYPKETADAPERVQVMRAIAIVFAGIFVFLGLALVLGNTMLDSSLATAFFIGFVILAAIGIFYLLVRNYQARRRYAAKAEKNAVTEKELEALDRKVRKGNE